MMIRMLLSVLAAGITAASCSAQVVADFRDAARETKRSFLWIESEPQPSSAARFLKRDPSGPNILFWGNDSAQFPGPALPVNTASQRERTIAFAVDEDLVIASRIRPDEVTLNDNSGAQWKGKVIVRDHTTALSVIRIEKAGLRPLLVAEAEPDAGLPVLVVNQLNDHTTGYNALMIASEPISDSWQIGMTQAISGAISRQSYGAPLLRRDGTLVGVLARQGNETRCLSVQHLLRLIKEAAKLEPADLFRGHIGIRINDSDVGAVVDQVMADTPAEDSVIHSGDLLISVNGAACDSAADVMAAVAMARAGDDVTIILQRDGESIESVLSLAAIEVAEDVETGGLGAKNPKVMRQFYKWVDGELVPMSPGKPMSPGNPVSPGEPVSPAGPVSPRDDLGSLDLLIDPNSLPRSVVVGSLSVERSGVEDAIKNLEAQKKAQDKMIKQLRTQIAELESQAKANLKRAEERERRRLEEIVEEFKQKLQTSER